MGPLPGASSMRRPMKGACVQEFYGRNSQGSDFVDSGIAAGCNTKNLLVSFRRGVTSFSPPACSDEIVSGKFRRFQIIFSFFNFQIRPAQGAFSAVSYSKIMKWIKRKEILKRRGSLGWGLLSGAFSMRRPMKGAFSKGFYGRNSQGSDFVDSGIAASCNTENLLVRFRRGATNFSPPACSP
jgi:hypothetical protein